jgi:cysteine-rich secretory family protein
MRCALRFRALLGVAIAPLLFAVLVSAGITGFARDTSAAGDCTADPALDSEELAFLTLINNHRAQNGLTPLAPSYTLSKAAQWKSNDLGVNAYLAHDDLFRTWVQRLRDCGHTANAWLGENIAGGTMSAQAAFDGWRNSPAHNANMLGAAYTGIGIGRAYVAGSPYGWYWTTEFTSINDPFPSAPTPTRTPTRTPTPAPTATPAPRVPVHVADLDAQASGSTFWFVRIQVRVEDASGRPVAAAIVNGRWDNVSPATCVTDSAGTCTVRIYPGKPSIAFTVKYVSKSGGTYTASANADSDGDSDGTTIVVTK